MWGRYLFSSASLALQVYAEFFTIFGSVDTSRAFSVVQRALATTRSTGTSQNERGFALFLAACALRRASITRVDVVESHASMALAGGDVVDGAVAVVVHHVTDLRGRDDRADTVSPCFSIGAASLFSGATSPLAGE